MLIGVAILAVRLAPDPTDGYPANWGKLFEVGGESRSWQVQSLFSPADFGPRHQPDLGFEFSTGDLTYIGKPAQLKWYRIGIFLPEDVGVLVRPADCSVDTRDPEARGGTPISPGQHFNHRICIVYPWSRSAAELASKVAQGLYVVSWEDDMGVHAEALPLAQIRWK